MSRGPTTFRQRDLSAAIKAALAAGCAVARVKVEKDGTIVLVLVTGEERSTGPNSGSGGNEWDEILK